MIPAKSSLPVIVLCLATLVLTVAAGLMLFSTFMLYDDEGYVLLSLKNFAEHGSLYGDVYSQYGPLPYVAYYVLHLLGLPFTHDAGRLLTLTAWTGTAGLAGVLVWRSTRNFGATLTTLAATFVYLWIMVSEPNHPGGLVALLTALLAAIGCGWLSANRTTRWAALAGGLSAALVLTKINVGVFAALSTAAFMLLHAQHAGVRRTAPWLVGAGLVVLPFTLMRSLLAAPWVETYATLFALAGFPVAWSAARAAGSPGALRCSRRDFFAAIGSAVIVFVVVIGVVLARGTTSMELLTGMLLGPLKHPIHFSLAYHWPAGATLGAIGSAVLFGAAVASRGNLTGAARIDTTVAVLRLAGAFGAAAAILGFPTTSPDGPVFAFGLSFLWVFLWPLAGENSAALAARTWLVLLLLGQWLHAYPVPGSQIAWGTFLALPLAAIGAVEAAVWLTRRLPRPTGHGLRLWLTVQLILVAAATVTGARLLQIGSRYFNSRPLGLPGASLLRLPDSTTATYRLLSVNAAAHTDLLFSLPGMFSFNFWSERSTPTLANVTHWFSLLDEAQQQKIIQALESHPRSGVIVQSGHLDFLRARGLTPAGPLYDYIMRNFTAAFAVDDFEFRVRTGRRIAPLLTAEIFQRPPGAPDDKDPFNTKLESAVLLPPGQLVASLEVVRMDTLGSAQLVLNATNAHVEVTPIDLEGDPTGPSVARAFPLQLHGAALISVYFDRGSTRFPLANTVIVLRDPAGAELTLVRLRP